MERGAKRFDAFLILFFSKNMNRSIYDIFVYRVFEML